MEIHSSRSTKTKWGGVSCQARRSALVTDNAEDDQRPMMDHEPYTATGLLHRAAGSAREEPLSSAWGVIALWIVKTTHLQCGRSRYL